MTDQRPTIRALVEVEIDITTGAIVMQRQLPVPNTREQLTKEAPAPLEVAIAAWLDAKAHRSDSAKTRRAYADTLGAFRSALQAAGLDLNTDPRAISLAAQGWAGRDDPAPATYNQRLAVLSSFYQFALKRGLLIGDNPIRLVERRRVDTYGAAEPLDQAEVKHRLAQIERDDLTGQRDYALLATFLQTGRRLAEVVSLRWRDVQVQGDRVTLQFRRAKGGKVMADRLPIALGQALLTWLSHFYGPALGTLPPDAPIWVSLARNSYGRALSTRSVSVICTDRLGISKVHALRHTFARTMEDAGAKVSEIQARLGHTSMATTGRYLAALKRAENTHADELARRFGIDE